MAPLDEEDLAFGAFVAPHAAALARLARHYEAAPEARRDLEQDILLALWRARAGFRGEASERTWVYRIAHNIAATYVARAIRARRNDFADVGEKPSLPPDEVLASRQALDRRLRKLELSSRQLVLLALEGCSMAEIAEITGLSATNVTTRLSRLRKSLAEDAS